MKQIWPILFETFMRAFYFLKNKDERAEQYLKNNVQNNFGINV